MVAYITQGSSAATTATLLLLLLLPVPYFSRVVASVRASLSQPCRRLSYSRHVGDLK